MNRTILNAYQNACDCLYYGYGKGSWDDCGLNDYNIAHEVWMAAKNDLASNDTNRPYDQPSAATKKVLEDLSVEYERVSDSRRRVKDGEDFYEEESKEKELYESLLSLLQGGIDYKNVLKPCIEDLVNEAWEMELGNTHNQKYYVDYLVKAALDYLFGGR